MCLDDPRRCQAPVNRGSSSQPPDEPCVFQKARRTWLGPCSFLSCFTSRTRASGERMENGSKRDEGRERRRDPRRSLQTRVALKTDKAIFFMESLDISTTGIRVQSEIGIEVGTRCRLIPFFDVV